MGSGSHFIGVLHSLSIPSPHPTAMAGGDLEKQTPGRRGFFLCLRGHVCSLLLTLHGTVLVTHFTRS